MNSDQLSRRLGTVAAFIPQGSTLADIGSDHAYLPCHLAKRGLIKKAIAGEVVEGPFHSAKRQVNAEGLTDMIDVRMGDGLEVIHPGEVECISIAGMGGTLISEILEAGKEKLPGVKRLVLQPNISAVSIRKWLHRNGWELMAEEIVEEDGKIYEILAAEKGDPDLPYRADLEKRLLFGPFLMEKKSDVFKKKWSLEKANWERILGSLEKARATDDSEVRKRELRAKIILAEEVLG